MADFSKNPKKPFEVRVPNKIRTRIAMHEKTKDVSIVKSVARAILPPLMGDIPKKKRGSMWSRFTSKVANIFQIKPSGVRE